MTEDEDEPLVPQEVLDAMDSLIEGDTASKEEIEEVLDIDFDDEPDWDDQERKPCGEYHPLPCGIDVWCADLEDE